MFDIRSSRTVPRTWQDTPVDASPSTDPPEDRIKKSAEAARRRKETEDEVQEIDPLDLGGLIYGCLQLWPFRRYNWL